MQVNLNNTGINFTSSYVLGHKYYREQAKAANTVEAYINSTGSTNLQDYSIVDKVEEKGWDVLIKPGKYLNSSSVYLAKGLKTDDFGYFAYKKMYVGDFYKGNVEELEDEINSKLEANKSTNIIAKTGVLAALVFAGLFALSGISKCSSSKALDKKEFINNSQKTAQDTLKTLNIKM